MKKVFVDGENKVTCKKEFYNLLKDKYLPSVELEMGVLTCEEPIKPLKGEGVFERPNHIDKVTLAEYWRNNVKEMDQKTISQREALEEVESWLEGKKFYVLRDSSGEIVSMAGYGIIDDLAKITHVFTPKEERRKGYCQFLIYSLSKQLIEEGYKPVLYTDYQYEASNRAYQKVGFQDKGTLMNISIQLKKKKEGGMAMERLFYEAPSIERKEDALDYIREFQEYGSQIHGVGGLDSRVDNYEEWLLKLEEDKTRVPTEERVPAETYFLVRESDNRIVGMVNIRLVLNSILKHSGGHIGYSIRPTERRKGYNKMNLYLALERCKEHGIKEVMLSCDKDNLGSKRTMLALGGVLQKEYEDLGLIEQNYIINVKESLEKYKDLYATHTIRKR